MLLPVTRSDDIFATYITPGNPVWRLPKKDTISKDAVSKDIKNRNDLNMEMARQTPCRANGQAPESPATDATKPQLECTIGLRESSVSSTDTDASIENRRERSESTSTTQSSIKDASQPRSSGASTPLTVVSVASATSTASIPHYIKPVFPLTLDELNSRKNARKTKEVPTKSQTQKIVHDASKTIVTRRIQPVFLLTIHELNLRNNSKTTTKVPTETQRTTHDVPKTTVTR